MDVLNIINKKFITLIGFVIVTIISIVCVFSYINSQQFITIKYKNISKVTIQKFKQGVRWTQDATVIPKSGEKIKVSKGDYLLKYTGNNGYASKYENITIQDKPVVISLDPDYSESRLINMLDKDFDTIKVALSAKYQNIGDYNIEKGKLYGKGKWYATTLQYIGNDYFNYDSLRLVMNKENGSWKVITDPPSIVINSHNYPNIPIDVLQDVNNVQNAPFADKYTDSNSKVYFP